MATTTPSLSRSNRSERYIEEQSILLAEIREADHQLRLQAEEMPKAEE